MDSIQGLPEILVRSIVSVIVLMLLTKLMGKKQISQLNFFDYAIGISIGSIAAEMATATEIPFYHSLLAMIIYSAISTLITLFTIKSFKARSLLTGGPIVLIERGKLVKKGLKRARFDINDLLRECRIAGYFNIGDIEYAVMEASGTISFLPVSDKRPVTPYDMGISPKQEEIVANVIIDGKVMKENLKHSGKNEEWLDKQLKDNKLALADVFLGVCDSDGVFTAYIDSKNNHKHNIFE